jgi:hypothetical protein
VSAKSRTHRRGLSRSRDVPVSDSYGPTFYQEGGGDKTIGAVRADVTNAIANLDEARCLFSLLGLTAAYRQSWVQPIDWLMSAGLGSGTFVGRDIAFLPDRLIDSEAATSLAVSYFAIDKSSGHHPLRHSRAPGLSLTGVRTD